MSRKKRVLDILKALIRIDSQNPPGDERLVARYIQNLLRKNGLRARCVECRRKRANVILHIKGRDHRVKLLVSPHLDTVPAGRNWKYSPFSGMIKNKKMYGRGATDCKCNVAIAIEAILRMKEHGIRPRVDIIFCASADEETGSHHGLIPLLNKKIIRPTHALILDSDDFHLITAQKGLLHFKIEIFGKKAHGAYPWLGENAIEAASCVICDLKKYRFRARASHALLRPPTVNIGKISGGDKVNIVADYCAIEVDARFLPGMDEAGIRSDIDRIVRRHAKKFRLSYQDIQAPYEISSNHIFVKKLKGMMEKHHAYGKIKGSEGATVITFLGKKKIPAVSFGVGTKGQAHAQDEYVKVGDVARGADILFEFMRGFHPDQA